jgi:formate-dependent phosphoribosylglycinamide formyltransferase (GAR transformylase)
MTDAYKAMQLTLDFATASAMKDVKQRRVNVVPFVDAATLDVRREAIRRLASSGIFEVPANLRCR